MQRLFKDMFILFLGAFAALYLMFPTFGVFELIPDVIPFIGNLDEAGATLLILNVLNYFNIDVTNFFTNSSRKEKPKSLPRTTQSRQPDDR